MTEENKYLCLRIKKSVGKITYNDEGAEKYETRIKKQTRCELLNRGIGYCEYDKVGCPGDKELLKDLSPACFSHYCNKCNQQTKQIIDDSVSSTLYIDQYCATCGAYIRYVASKMEDGSYKIRPQNTSSSIVIL